MINRKAVLFSKLIQALKLEYWQLSDIQEWATCLFVAIRSNPSNLSRRYRFVSYKVIQSLPTKSGEYFMIEGDRRLSVEVDLIALDTELGLSTFIVRSLEKSPRTWEFDTFRGQITRGFDWEGELIPRQILRAIEFKPVPTNDSIDRVLLTLAGKLPRARVRSEWEVSRG